MAVPRNRHSLARTRQGRANKSCKAQQLTACKKCSRGRLAHAACPFCGEFNGSSFAEFVVAKQVIGS